MSLNPLAVIRDTCHRTIRLDMFEEVTGFRQEPDRIILAVGRAKSKPRRGMAWHVTQRGTTLYTFRRTETGWELADTVTVWWSTDELHEPF